MDESTTKFCSACHGHQPRSEFYKCSNAKDGLASACKPCLAARRRKRRAMTDEDRRAERERREEARRARLTAPTKRCSRCFAEYPKSMFYKSAGKADGLLSQCKSCSLEMQRSYRARKPESSRNHSREAMRRRREENPEAEREYARAWRAANPHLVRKQKREWNDANRERVRTHSVEAKRRWKRDNPEKLKQYDLARRAAKAGANRGDVNLAALWDIQGGTCGLCDGAIDRALSWPDPMSPSVDHIVPLSKGGAHAQSNLQYAHLVCNVSKGARLTEAEQTPPELRQTQ